MGTAWFWGHGSSTPLSCGFRLSPRLPRSPMLHFPALDSSPCPFCFYGTKIEIKSETARKKKETPRVQRWKMAFLGGGTELGFISPVLQKKAFAAPAAAPSLWHSSGGGFLPLKPAANKSRGGRLAPSVAPHRALAYLQEGRMRPGTASAARCKVGDSSGMLGEQQDLRPGGGFVLREGNPSEIPAPLPLPQPRWKPALNFSLISHYRKKKYI